MKSKSTDPEPMPIPEPAPAAEPIPAVQEPQPAPPEPTPAPPEPEPIDHVAQAIASVQTDPEYVHRSAEHLEVRAIRKLVEELGWEIRRAEVAVRARLY